MAPRPRPLLTPPNDGTQKKNKLDLRVALKKGAGHGLALPSERTSKEPRMRRLPMRKIADALRLKAAGLATRKIAASLNVLTVVELDVAQEGLTCPPVVPLQYRPLTQRPRLSPASPGKHHSDGSETHHALIINWTTQWGHARTVLHVWPQRPAQVRQGYDEATYLRHFRA